MRDGASSRRELTEQAGEKTAFKSRPNSSGKGSVKTSRTGMKEGSNRERAKYLSTKMPCITVEELIADSRAKEKQLFHVVGTQEGVAGSGHEKEHLQRG